MRIEVKPEYKDVSADEVLAALANDGTEITVKEVAICTEVGRLMEGYTTNFVEFCKRHGGIPEQFLHAKGSCDIETIAMELTSKVIKESLT